MLGLLDSILTGVVGVPLAEIGTNVARKRAPPTTEEKKKKTKKTKKTKKEGKKEKEKEEEKKTEGKVDFDL